MNHKPWLLIMQMLSTFIFLRSHAVCLEDERVALLEIKVSLLESYGYGANEVLRTWVDHDTECCDWERVKCNTTTGRVTTLSLNHLDANLNVGVMVEALDDEKKLWTLNVSLFLRFEDLRSLNLSWNYLDNRILTSEIKRLARLKKLEILDLSYNSDIDIDVIPALTQITSLKVLDLSYTGMNGTFPTNEIVALENLEMFSLAGCVYFTDFASSLRLSNLKTLNLNTNSFNESIISSLKFLPSLKNLDLSGNDISGPFPPQELAQLTSLEKLDLSSNWIYGAPSIRGCKILSRLKRLKSITAASINFEDGTKILSCLSAIPSLKILDLTYSFLLQSFIPIQALASFHQLEVLDLSYNSFVGSIPSTIKSLSSLKVLSFANCTLKGSLSPDHGLCELKNLQELDLSRNMLSGDLPKCLNNLSSLKLLDISSNQFTGMPLNSLIPNLTALEYIDISHNNFEGSFSFSSFSNCAKLEVVKFINNNDKFEVETEEPIGWIPLFQLKFLMLPNCNINRHKGSVFPSFLVHENALRVLDLSHNSLKGEFPNWLIKNNTILEVLNLKNNSLAGTLSLPLYENANAWWIDVSSNQINGTIPNDIQNLFPYIAHLNMSRNGLRGRIPSSVGDLRELFALDLSHNELFGEVPKGLFTNMSLLTLLHLSNNRLQGEILSGNVTTGTIEMLHLNDNYFAGKLGNATSSTLSIVDISNNLFTGMVPASWVSNMQDTSQLVMNNNMFEGQFPCGTTSFEFLDISQNLFSGNIPSCLNLQYMQHLHLGSNRFSGSIPDSFRNLTNILVLDIGKNDLSGRIPKYVGELQNLRILLMRENNFRGPIPKRLCKLRDVSLLDLSGNSLSGSIPSCLQIATGPSYRETIPSFWWSYPRDLYYAYASRLGKVLSVHNDQEALGILVEVQFTTKSMSRPYKGNVLEYMTGLDLSSNRLTGEIPEKLGLLNQIRTLNLSSNRLTGPIPINFSNLASVESLDLSSNSLSGSVPSELVNLDSLAVFNVSYNNLSGKLPEMIRQFGTFSSASYQGNPLLCGLPLERKCNGNEPENVPAVIEDNEKWSDHIDKVWFVASLSSTWIVFLLGYAAVLYTNRYWREMWFNFVERCMYTVYYFLVDLVTRPSVLFRL